MSELLSSDALERQFGPTELEVLWQDGLHRVIATKVAASGQILELSQVEFRPEGIAAFPDIHRAVVAGTSMGKAFAQTGLEFDRKIHAAYRYDQHNVPAGLAERFGSGEPPTVMDLSVVVGPEATAYADILEIYSPKVAWELTGGELDQAVVARINDFGATLASLDRNA